MSIPVAPNANLLFRSAEIVAMVGQEFRAWSRAFAARQALRRQRLVMERAFRDLDPRTLRDIGFDMPSALAMLAA
jgi:hypothetical protein